MSVRIRLTAGDLKPEEYRVRVPKAAHHLFPNYYAAIELHTDDLDVMVRHYNPKYRELSIGRWLHVHPELKPGDRVRITAIEPMKKYRLEILR